VLEAALWAVALAVLSWTTLVRPAVAPSIAATTHSLAPAPALPAYPAEPVLAAARTVIEGNPFRLDRRPADAPFAARATERESGEYGIEWPPERPRLVLRGILGGPPWNALLDGLPEHESSVLVQVGDLFGDYRVRSIDGYAVVVQSADSIWKLTLEAPWQ
jgi:hypothetical protein